MISPSFFSAISSTPLDFGACTPDLDLEEVLELSRLLDYNRACQGIILIPGAVTVGQGFHFHCQIISVRATAAEYGGRGEIILSGCAMARIASSLHTLVENIPCLPVWHISGW